MVSCYSAAAIGMINPEKILLKSIGIVFRSHRKLFQCHGMLGNLATVFERVDAKFAIFCSLT